MEKYNYETLAHISFKIITSAGSAKSDAMEAIYAIKNQDQKTAMAKIESAHKNMIEAEKQHAELIQAEASGEKINIPILFMHAEDQLLTTQTLIMMAEEFIDLYKLVHSIKK